MKDDDIRGEPTEREHARAVFYVEKWIAPLLHVEEGERTALVAYLAEQEWEIPHSRRIRVSQSTIWRLLAAYEKGGLPALYRKRRKDSGVHRKLPPRILEEAIKLRADLRSRSVARIMKTLKKMFPKDMASVKRSTLSRALTEAGCGRIRPRRASRTGPKKERHIHMRWERPLQLVQSDVCGKSLWVTERGKRERASLIVLLDHCSKLALHGEWVLSANLPALEKCVVAALQIHGIFERLHVDHGAIYESYLLRNACADLGIMLKYTKKGYAEGKGGIERFFLTVEEDFIPEVGDSTRFCLAELNSKYRGWEHDYHRTVHSATGETPLERFQRLSGEPRFPDPLKLRHATLLREPRVVDKRFCSVSIRTKELVVDPALAGRRVQVRYDPYVLDEALIYDIAGRRLLQRALPRDPAEKPAPFLPETPPHPTPAYDILSELEAQRQSDLSSSMLAPSRPSTRRPRFADFCRQVGALLEREGCLDDYELSTLKEIWERYGPFTTELVTRTLEPLVASAGPGLHIASYMSSLVAAHLNQEKE